MLLSLSWLRDFVAIPEVSPRDFETKVTMAIAEVEEVISTGQHLQLVKVVQIKSLRKHPEADKLNLVTFDYGSGTKEVVCGAPNVRVGLKIAYAPVGTKLPNGMELTPKNIRGIISEGMLCSAAELGLGDGQAGLLELSPDAPVGQNLGDYLKQPTDTLLDIDNKSLTHRPDLWGHYGFARELSLLFNQPLKRPYDEAWKKKLEKNFTSQKSPLTPMVEKNSSGLIYWGLSVDGVRVTTSPDWMKQRLEAVGLRSINSIVDISNYVMLELGMPLHIFDREKIAGEKVFIRLNGESNTFVTLDEVERKLLPSDTVIADARQPLVLAGIMGGLHSGVSDSTQKIFIEVANWKAPEVRKTSTRLGLRSESSQRYEKTLDSSLCYQTLLRTLDLVLQLNPGAKVVGKPEVSGDDLNPPKPLEITTSFARIEMLLGRTLERQQVVKWMEGLEFKVSVKGDELKLQTPSFRQTKDIQGEADILEEIGRLLGYDHIPPQAPVNAVSAVRLSPEHTIKRKVQDFLSLQAGASEIMTYPLVGIELLKQAAWPVKNEELVLVNSLSVEADRMRPSLIPSLLQAVAENQKHYSDFKLFEYGRAYQSVPQNFATESNQIIIGFYSKSQSPFLALINTVEKLLNYLQVPFQFETHNEKHSNPLLPAQWKGAHPFEFLNLKIMGRFAGGLTTAHPLILREFKSKGYLSLAVIDCSSFEKRAAKDSVKYSPLAKFPVATFDCTVVAATQYPAAQALEIVQKLKLPLLKKIKIVDVYKLSNDQKSITLRATFANEQASISSEELKAGEAQIVKILAENQLPLKS